MLHVSALNYSVYLYDKPINAHLYVCIYLQSHIVIHHQHVSVHSCDRHQGVLQREYN